MTKTKDLTNFCFVLPHRRSTTVSLETRNPGDKLIDPNGKHARPNRSSGFPTTVFFKKTVNSLDRDSRPINRNGKAARGAVHIIIWISAAHLPGTSNVAADKASRAFCDQTEWKLDETIFANI